MLNVMKTIMGTSEQNNEVERSHPSTGTSVGSSERPSALPEPVTAVSGGGGPGWSSAMATSLPLISHGTGENLLSRLDRAGEIQEAKDLRARIKFGEAVAEKATKRLLDQRSVSAGVGQVENQRSLYSGLS